MAIIVFQKPTKKHFFFLAFIVSSFIRFLCQERMVSNVKDIKDSPIYIKELRYFDFVTNIVGDLITGILHYLSELKRKNEYKKLRRQSLVLNPGSKLNINEPHIYNIFSFKKVILEISALDFICQFVLLIFTLIYGKDNVIPPEFTNIFLLLDILSRYLFSLIILKTYFYRHQYFSLLINLIVFIVLGFFDLSKFGKFDDNKTITTVYAIFSAIRTILYSLEDVLNKIALTKESFTPYAILFYKGFYQLIFLFLPVTLIMIFFSGGEDNDGKNYYNIFTFFWDASLKSKTLQKEIIFRILFGIFNIARCVLLVYVIDVFSSQHLSVLRILESLFIFIYLYFMDITNQRSDEKNIKNLFGAYDIIIYIFCYFILVFTSFIHNEIMVIKLFGLDKFTEQGLQEQAKEDLMNAMNENNSSMSDEPTTDNNISENASFNIQNISADYD